MAVGGTAVGDGERKFQTLTRHKVRETRARVLHGMAVFVRHAVHACGSLDSRWDSSRNVPQRYVYVHTTVTVVRIDFVLPHTYEYGPLETESWQNWRRSGAGICSFQMLTQNMRTCEAYVTALRAMVILQLTICMHVLTIRVSPVPQRGTLQETSSTILTSMIHTYSCC